MNGKELYEFGRFRLDPTQRELVRDGRPIPLTPKAFDTLLLLVERRGSLVSKADMLAAIWPDTSVEEGNLAWNVSAVRKALAGDSGDAAYIETIPKFGYRFVGEVRVIQTAPAALPASVVPVPFVPVPVPARVASSQSRRWLPVAITIMVVAAIVTALVALRSRPSALAERDWILIANVDNRTGEADFDDVLTDTVAVQFDQSPYFRVFSRERIDEQLALMRRQAGDRVTDEIAREVCERASVKAFVSGSIDKVGNAYVVRLAAIDARSGDTISRNQNQVRDAAAVLRVIGEASAAIRRDLGESLQSIDRFDVPPALATTSSLAALRAFRQGQAVLSSSNVSHVVAKQFFTQAIELDPDFALAYARLGSTLANLRDRNGSAAAAQEAFLRRDRVSERERYEIASLYYRDVSGEMPKALESLLMWSRAYPDEPRPFNALQISQRDIGLLIDAAVNGETAVRLRPDYPTYHSNLVGSYLRLNRFDDARRVADEAIRNNVASLATHRLLQRIAVLTNDRELDAREAKWRVEKAPNATTVELDAALAGAAGRMQDARRGYAQAIKMSSSIPGRAADYLSRLASYEAYAGARHEAVAAAKQVRAGDASRYVAADAAFVLALLDSDLTPLVTIAAEYPQDTLIAELWMPLARGVVALRAGRAAEAIGLLRSMATYDLGDYAYLRGSYHLGEAFLALRDGAQARQAFQRVIDHRGVIPNQSLFAIAHLGLARVAAMTGDRVEARAAYARFFETWPDADPDLPVMRAARAEAGRLK